MCGSDESGRFLSHLADGAHTIWPKNSSMRAFANKLEREMGEIISNHEVSVNVLLRFITRHGRLHPGLAPPVVGEYVSGERGDTS